ncbi:hypothetical protein CJD36_015590 [Flavipsychrobacter stenotrophus]|uniref:Uncharacterized protein n=1 Tax=Flavipsychrobacter stenotrophus TaxID=2077091 RepID=A0A2S7STQ9_9BACT|nr:hypothetical protein [Flavipsychrobacter stenotrophus]PQJ10118.1 hypothetical protein CJD36_015590 [Flavipsychrobacter stenotrophus]
MNIKLCYLYRDGANYKRYGKVVFENTSLLPLHKIGTAIIASLIEGEWFYAKKWNLPDLHFDKWDNEIDHDYHEYSGIEETEEQPTQGDISDFLKQISNEH